MRLLFWGDAAPSGFGTVTSDLGRELLNLGIDVRFVSQNDTGNDLPEPFRSRTADVASLVRGSVEDGVKPVVGASELIPSLVYGTAGVNLTNGQPWGDWKPEACILLGDYRAAQIIIARATEAFSSLPTLHYVPIEGTDLPPDWAKMWKIVKPVAMSRFGAKQIAKVLGHQVPMIYHGVDAEVFRPASVRPVVIKPAEGIEAVFSTREACKVQWAQVLAKINNVERIPRKWLLRTDRNMPRKQYARMLRALAPVLARNTGWGLVIHCSVFDQGGMLADSASKYPAIRDRILFTDLSLEREALVMLYNAADLYVTNSAEGFGLTIAEAIACGIPAVGVRYSAVPEVIGPAGVTVDRFALIDNEYDHYWCAVDEQAFGAAVEKLMRGDAHREALGAKGPKHIASSFSWANAARQFLEVLEAEVAAWHPSPASPQSGNTSRLPLPPASSQKASSGATSG